MPGCCGFGARAANKEKKGTEKPTANGGEQKSPSKQKEEVKKDDGKIINLEVKDDPKPVESPKKEEAAAKKEEPKAEQSEASPTASAKGEKKDTTASPKVSKAEGGGHVSDSDDDGRQNNQAEGVDEEDLENFVAPVHEKNEEQKKMIKAMMYTCKTLKNLMGDALDECMDTIVMALHLKELKDGEKLITQGEDGRSMYIIDSGDFSITMFTKMIGEKEIRVVNEGTLGEVALALNIARTASVTAKGPGRVWVLDRHVFNGIRMQYEMSTKRQYEKFLRGIAIFGDIEPQTLLMLADAFTAEEFKAGENIITQGDEDIKMFVLKEGQCEAVLHDKEKGDKVVRLYKDPGEYFGEISVLVQDSKRTASIRAKTPCVVLSLDKNDFDRIMGSKRLRQILMANRDKYPKYDDFKADEIQETAQDKEAAKEETKHAEFGRSSLKAIPDNVKKEMQVQKNMRYTIEDMKLMETIGRGGFGRVRRAAVINKEKLPEIRGEKIQIVAFKILRKDRLRKAKDVRHVIDEKNLMLKMNHPFIARLFGVGQDDRRLFFALEHVEGGDLFSLIRRKHYLGADQANLCGAEVVLALGHMHEQGIIYRDLKPENVLLDTEGHVKVIDFGFAIQLGRGQRAWTQCGTPCYMAPELVLGKGYQASVDWWALGVLIYEMLMGHSPFDDQDPMATLKKIIAFDPSHIKINHDQGAQSISRALLVKTPQNRLGCSKGDSSDVRKHPWFGRLDWNLLQLRKYRPPYKPELDQVKARNKMIPESKDQPQVPKSKEIIKLFADF